MAVWDPKETLDNIGLGRTEQKRSVRVADAMKNELSILLLQKVRDPKLANVSISRIKLTDDLKNAQIFYTVLGSEKDIRNAGKGLERAKGFIRTHLAKTLNMRHTPSLRFTYDDKADKVREIENLFQEIENERRNSGKDS